MGRSYAQEPAAPKKSTKTRGEDLRVHFKNTYEVARALKGQSLQDAQKYLEDVLAHKRCVPFTRFRGGVGRTGQAKEFGFTQGRWPTKSVKVLQGLLQNLDSNAKVRSLSSEKLILQHVQVNRAQKGRRRTYRAHGRINPYLSSNCHVEIWATEKDDKVQKEANKKQVARLSRKQIAKTKLAIGQ